MIGEEEGRLPWFPCAQSKLLEALAQMQPSEGYVYCVMLLRIYDCGGACPDDIEAIAKRTGYSKRVASDALNRLFKAGRLRREADGIHNPVADRVIEKQIGRRKSAQSSGAEGGRLRWEKTKQKQRKLDSEPTLTLEGFGSYLDLEKEKKEDSRFPDGNRREERDKTNPEPLDERTLLFRNGLDVLVRITGKPQDRARALIGGWLRVARDDAVLVRRTIEDAERNRVADPIPWIKRALETRVGKTDVAGSGTRNGFAALAAKMHHQQREDDDVEHAGGSHDRGLVPAAEEHGVPAVRGRGGYPGPRR